MLIEEVVVWYKRFDTFIVGHAYFISDYDSCVFQEVLRWFIYIIVVVC